MLYTLFAAALADVIVLDTGANLNGDLARYEYGGDCQISVMEGDLTGVIVIVPCHRVLSFVRTDTRVPEPIGLAAVHAPEPAPVPELVEEAEAPEAEEPPVAPVEAPVVEDKPAPPIVEERPAPRSITF